MNLVARIALQAARTIGVAPSEIPHESRQAVASALYKQVAKGRLFRAQLGPKTVRYFTRLEMRDAFVIALNTAKAEAEAAKASDDGFRPGWAANTPVIVPPGVRVQVCPSQLHPLHEPRFQGDHVLPGIVSFGLQRGRVTIDQVDAVVTARRLRNRGALRRHLGLA